MAYEQGKEMRRKLELEWGMTEEQIKQSEERLEQRLNFEAKREKIIGAMLQQCADEDLTVSQTREVLLVALKEFDAELQSAKVFLIHNQYQNCTDSRTHSSN